MRFDFPTFGLHVNGDDVVEGLDEGWNPFVGGHRVAALAPVQPGARFWEAIQGGRAATLYEVMLARARSRHRVALDVRAAEPGRLKGVELALTPRGFDGDVDVQLRVLFEREARAAAALFDPDAPRDDSEVDVCVFCQRVRAFDWVEPDLAVEQLRVLPDRPQPRLARTICSTCEDAVYSHCDTPRLRI